MEPKEISRKTSREVMSLTFDSCSENEEFARVVVAIFAAIILWTVLYNYTLPADEKKKRLIMLGEAEEE